ncbi:MAG: UDP-N-acetylmuramoyl-L-alanyl-D-glutamate--2,6-diaminopimelate ligase [Candidatus Aegiribacteria sp.]|nr:UDP-N-acetylmuramoyl-L-alanyl-D-glutamate--2,6-diaminopimelate ligase [Candidatus Aegiribacteria sp.]
MILSDLLRNTRVRIPGNLAPVEITSVEEDSRNVTAGSLFVALRGFETDGHIHIKQALDSGAAAVLAERQVSDDQRICVNPDHDNRGILSLIAARFYDYPWDELVTIGITGTNGKTSTARMLHWILEKHDMQSGIMGTIGHLIGGKNVKANMTTPGALVTAGMMREMIQKGDRCCIMEVSSHALSLSRVDEVRFDAALFTNISQDHLDFHQSMEEYLNCKKHLFDLLKVNGTSIIGTYSAGFPSIDCAVTFGPRENDTYRISDISGELGRISFLFQTDGTSIPVEMSIPGKFNTFNAAGALAAAIELGVDPLSASKSLKDFPGVPGRFQSVSLGQDFLVAVDYAHTPDALERILRQASELTENRVIIVFGAGGDRDSSKRPLMGHIAENIADIVIITSDNPRTEAPDSIIGDIVAGLSSTPQCLVIVEPDRRTAIRSAISVAEAGDVVIIAGKGHEDYQILGKKRIHFDDREEAAAALEEVLE